MALWMVGIDHEKADLSTRELFSFHKHSAIEAMLQMKATFHFSGVILLSTCNRTELYVSTDELEEELFSILCQMKNIDTKAYQQYKVERKGEEAIDHLFHLACGMKSRVFGEDQIITQIKTALFQAREIQTVDSYLEEVFQAAISTAKKVKSQVHLTAVQTSIMEQVLQVLRNQGIALTGKRVLVIGNGEIGRLAAATMVQEKAYVTITVRNYKTKQVEIPAGCQWIDYKERYQTLGSYDIIISGTSSPHHTIKYEECYELLEKNKTYVLFDLAVPRDISKRFSQVENVQLYNIDTLGGVCTTAQNNEAMAAALNIIKEQEQELALKQSFKVHVPTVQSIGNAGGKITYKRIEKNVKKLVEDSKRQELEELIEQAAEKTITSLLFDLRKSIPMEYWEICMEAFKKNLELE